MNVLLLCILFDECYSSKCFYSYIKLNIHCQICTGRVVRRHVLFIYTYMHGIIILLLSLSSLLCFGKTNQLKLLELVCNLFVYVIYIFHYFGGRGQSRAIK